jgi:hypothetical protein
MPGKIYTMAIDRNTMNTKGSAPAKISVSLTCGGAA